LKERLCEAMCRRGEDAHDTPLGRVRVQHASTRPVLLLVDPDDLPERFRRVAVSADKRPLTHALKEGDEVVDPALRGGPPLRRVGRAEPVPPHLLSPHTPPAPASPRCPEPVEGSARPSAAPRPPVPAPGAAASRIH